MCCLHEALVRECLSISMSLSATKPMSPFARQHRPAGLHYSHLLSSGQEGTQHCWLAHAVQLLYTGNRRKYRGNKAPSKLLSTPTSGYVVLCCSIYSAGQKLLQAIAAMHSNLVASSDAGHAVWHGGKAAGGCASFVSWMGNIFCRPCWADIPVQGCLTACLLCS